MSLLLILSATLIYPSILGASEPCTEAMKFDPYRWLETDSPQRREWVRQQNAKTLKKIRDSRYYKSVGKTVLNQMDRPFDISILSLENGEIVVLRNQGVGQPQVLVRRFATRQDSEFQRPRELEHQLRKLESEAKPTQPRQPLANETVLFSSHDISKAGTVNFTRAVLSPNRDFAIVFASEKGSIDDYNAYVFDLKTNKRVPVELKVGWARIAWQSPTRFYFLNSLETANGATPLRIFDLVSQKTETVDQKLSIQFSFVDAYIQYEEKAVTLRDSKGRSLELKDLEIEDIVSQFDSSVILKLSGIQGFGSAVEVNFDAPNEVRTVVPERSNRVLSKVTKVGEQWAAFSYYGENQYADIFGPNGQIQIAIKAPPSSTINWVKWDSKKENLLVGLTSQVASGRTAKFLVKENRFENPNLEQEMLTADGLQFESRIEFATSQDGTRLPVRITFKKGIALDGTNPSLIYGYGGFSSQGYFYPWFVPMDFQFLKRGGVIVTPILRGDNNFGPDWHKQGTFERKQNVFDDFTAAAELLTSLKISRPDRIAVEGWSNGGLGVAATSLQKPLAFGLIISGAGVQDMLRKEALDPRFSNGWTYEYGDSRKARDAKYLSQYSPVKQAELGRNPPVILLINGTHDSRVNSAHTYKLKAALDDRYGNLNNIHFLSVKNAGHWMTSNMIQDRIGWRSETFIWTFIYEYFGI
ncbi:MAG: S9 family peptidase [Oligoflexia bacterium]|nr:S9 family peptidase [Oligoflexia bacterium]